MSSEYICEGCRKPISYITQTCPHCGTPGPHIHRSQTRAGKPSSKRPGLRTSANLDRETPVDITQAPADLKKRTSPSVEDYWGIPGKPPKRSWRTATVILYLLAVILALVFVIGGIYIVSRDLTGTLGQKASNMPFRRKIKLPSLLPFNRQPPTARSPLKTMWLKPIIRRPPPPLTITVRIKLPPYRLIMQLQTRIQAVQPFRARRYQQILSRR